MAFVNSDFEGLIAAVRQRRNISQTQKWASVSLGTLLLHLHQTEVKMPACQNGPLIATGHGRQELWAPPSASSETVG